MSRSNEAQPGGLTAADVLAYLDRRTPPELHDDHVRAYREAAAVLDSIADLGHLRPAGPAPAGAAARLLEPDLIRTTGSAFHGAWMLRPETRAEAVRGLLAERGRVGAALYANPHEHRGKLQKQLERYLLGEAKPLSRQTPEDLEATLQVAVWLAGVRDGVPEVAEVQARLDYGRLLAPFEALAGDDVFRGRRRELDRLRSYIGVVAPESAGERLKGRVSQWLTPERQPAISISGIGGAGKSSLVARFMLEHTRLPEEERIPFGYLDFAGTTLDVGEPVGLCRELLRQLNIQFPGHAFSRGFGFLDDWRPPHADAGPANGKDTLGPATSVLTDILGLLRSRLGPRPYVIVLDTFEEVQYRGEERAFPLWELLSRMQAGAPFLRVVVAGRAPVESLKLAEKPPRQIVLGDLDEGAAAAFLETQGIDDPLLQRDFIAAFGRLPLSLKLASTLAAQTAGGAAALLGPGANGLSLTAASDEVIQAQLYRRILDRIADERLRRLAHPGLTLRRINPDLILHVLNEPCELLIGTIDEATALFEELRRETSLVSVDSADGDLVHRPDLRRVMLKMMLNGAPAVVTGIHRRAVTWYREQDGIRALAEYTYHRLHTASRAELSTEVPGRGGITVREGLRNREIRASIQVVIDEFPADVQLWLGAQGLEIPSTTREQASRDEAHAVIAAQIEDLLPYGELAVAQAERVFEPAYEALRDDSQGLRSFARSMLGRVDRGASPVFRAGARIAAQLGDQERALALIGEGLDRSARDGLSDLTIALLADRAWLYRDRPAAEQAEGLALLGEHARRQGARLHLVQHQAQLISDESDVAEAGLAKLVQLITDSGPDAVWNLVPALQKPIAIGMLRVAQGFTGPGGTTLPILQLGELLRLLIDHELSPFAEVVFPDARCQAALDSLLIEVSSPPVSRPAGHSETPEQSEQWRAKDKERTLRLLDAFVDLCEVWPYQVLYVSPPAGRRGEQLSVQ